jgi:hypothetical protein
MKPMPRADDPGLPLSLDADAKRASPELPAFLARPEGEPVYHGFQMLEGVEVDGFHLGTISALGPAEYGDAFIVAPRVPGWCGRSGIGKRSTR